MVARHTLRARRRAAPSVREGSCLRQSGFTLIEVMTVIALVAIVSAIAAPGFRSFIGTMNSKSAAFDLISDLTMARSEAIKRNANVTVQAVGNDWKNGWQVVSGAITLRERGAMNSALSLSGTPAPPAQVQFRPNGRLPDDTATDNLRWSISSSISGVTARCVVITPTGSARSKTGTCG